MSQKWLVLRPILSSRRGATSTIEHTALIVLVASSVGVTQHLISQGGSKYFQTNAKSVSSNPFDPRPGNTYSDEALSTNDLGQTSRTYLSRRRASMYAPTDPTTEVDGLTMGLTGLPHGGVYGAPIVEPSQGSWSATRDSKTQGCDDKGGGC